MQKSIFIIILSFLVMQAQAENPPASYQQFQTELLNIQPGRDFFPDEQDITFIGAGLGLGIVGVGGYFLLKEDTVKFTQVALIGGGLYAIYLAVVMLTEDRRSLCPAYLDAYKR